MASFDPQREELFHVAGDAPDPDLIGGNGLVSTIDLGHGALHPKVRYKDQILETDLYRIPGEPMRVVLYCPRCRNVLQIQEDRKAIEFDRHAGPAQDGGRLSVEAFECTWETGERGGDRMSFGLNLCRWRAVIDNNVARDV